MLHFPIDIVPDAVYLKDLSQEQYEECMHKLHQYINTQGGQQRKYEGGVGVRGRDNGDEGVFVCISEN